MDFDAFKKKVPVGHDDAALFDRVPPTGSKDAECLFVDREAEMAYAEGQLEALIQRPKKVILVVVGLARVGKSHFLTSLYNSPRICNQFHTVIQIRLTEMWEEIRLLREMWGQISKELIRYLKAVRDAPHVPKDERDRARDVLVALDLFLNRFRPVIEGSVAQMQVSLKESELHTLQTQITHTTKGGMVAGFNIPYLVKAEATGDHTEARQETQGATHGQERTHTLTVNAYTVQQIRELIGLLHELTRYVRPDHKTLLVVDDFDLLRRTATGTLQPDALLSHLFQLAQGDGFFVLTTVRKDTYQNNRHSFHQLVEIRPFRNAPPADPALPQKPSIMHEIYLRHVHLYHGDQAPFDAGFVEAAARSVDGRIGTFMELMRRAYHDLRTGHIAAPPRDLKHYVRDHWSDMEADNPGLAAELRELVVDRGQDVLPDDLAARIRNTTLIDAVTEDYSSANRLVVKRYVVDFLRQGQGRDEPG